MEFEHALEVANAAVYANSGRHLNDVETAILRGAWQNHTYEQIADTSGYSISYITRDIGPKLWKLLSQALGEPVSKTSFHAALERHWNKGIEHQKLHAAEAAASGQQSHLTADLSPVVTIPSSITPHASSTPSCDWGEASDISLFYGRTDELRDLQRWIQSDRCRLVALLGMGGIGKTSLAVKLAQQLVSLQQEDNQSAPSDSPASSLLQNSQAPAPFELVIWRSLRNAPPLKALLGDLVSFLSKQQDTEASLERLMCWLRHSRCLVILDNLESTMQAGDRAGHYSPGYEDYGELVKTVGETAHKSCLILTSREKPAEVAALEGMELRVRSLRLSGSLEAAQSLLHAKGLLGSEEQQQRLCHLYSCNPLALKIVATSIQDLFDGDIGAFLEQDAAVFSGIHRLLDNQCERCSPLEKTIMAWLAINREWTTISELAADIMPPVSRVDLLEALESLSWRSLIEKRSGRYTQQPVVMEYITNRLIEQVCQELRIWGTQAQADDRSASSFLYHCTFPLFLLQSHALLKAQGKDYICDIQRKQILQPILEGLLTALGGTANVEHHLMRLLTLLQRDMPGEPGYAGGNILNLLCQLQTDLTGFDLSSLTLWQADLRDKTLHRVNLSQADLSRSVFTEALTTPLTVTFSPDGRLLATGDVNSEVHVWQVANGRSVLTLKGHTNWIWSVDFSPDSRMLASGSDDSTIKLWDLPTGECWMTLQGHEQPVWSVDFSPDGQLLSSGSEDQTVKLWDLHTGACVQTLKGHDNWVRSVAFSPDGKRLASSSDDYTVKLWNLETGECDQTLAGHVGRVWSVAFSPTLQYLVSSSSDQTLKIWDLSTGKCIRTLHGHTNWVRALAFSPDGQTIASGSEDQTVRIWRVQTGECFRILKGHLNWVRSVAFSADGQLLATASGDHTVKLWDASSGQCYKTLQGYTNRVWSVAFSPDGRTLASGNDDRTVRLWTVKDAKCDKVLPGHTNAVCAVAFSQDGQLLASAGSDRTIKLWDTSTMQCRYTLQGHRSRIWSVAFSPAGHLLASGSDDKTIKLWDLKTGQCRQTLYGHANWVCAVRFSPVELCLNDENRSVLASAGYDRTVKLWDANTGELCQTLQEHDNWVWTLAFSGDGYTLASGSGDQTIKLWNLRTGTCDRTLTGHTGRVWSVVFSPDGTRLASASSDLTVKLWDVQTGQCLQTLTGHQNLVWSVSFSPDGRLLASGSQDEMIKLWDSETGKCLGTWQSDRPYEGMNIAGASGLTEAQVISLRALGAIEDWEASLSNNHSSNPS